MRKIVIYLEKDYEGDMNLLKNEKRLISKAFIKFNGDIGQMAKALETTEKLMLIKMLCHFGKM